MIQVEDMMAELEVLEKVLREGVGTLPYFIFISFTKQEDAEIGEDDMVSAECFFECIVSMLLVEWLLQKPMTNWLLIVRALRNGYYSFSAPGTRAKQ